VQFSERGETIGALIARVRTENGITQLRLAARLCASAGLATVTRHEISRWEREERIPSGHWLAWLALCLDVPLEQLERAAAVARFRRRHHRAGAQPPGASTRPSAAAGRWHELAVGVYQRDAS
jgi:transcriptional regulator with XRE-family HTH domain